ncbi:PKD domain-containing protein [Cellulomonas rhizosphaerae]|uniref:Ig-like domain-containing protein n=1 Tax=Cellulomonas rhizosphaerae TaxID=2293719 RepID=A0A413RP05_9CELL|nr:hypothetical protein [Cellulomonas rhizosphaerae]RHA43675.1 hypothetical protein D1825_05170 [Cellulomonas rhizosphaerae]
MTKYRWGMEGVANGTAFTTSTLTSTAPTGLNATTVSNGTGSNASDNTHVHTGSQALKVTIPTSSSQSYRLPFAAANNAAAISFCFWLAAAPAANFPILTLRHSSGIAGRLQFNSAGKLILLDSAGTGTIGTSTGTVTFGQWNVVDIVVNTTTGNITANLRAAGSGTVVATVTGTGASLSGNALTHIDLGAPSGNGTGSTQTIWFDDVQLDDGATSEIGEYVAANVPPSLSLTGIQTVAASAAVTCTATASDSDGSIVSYAWTGTRYTPGAAPASITLTNAATATCSYTAASSGPVLDVLQCIVTDDGGATNTKTTEVRVNSATTAITTLRMNGTGDSGWTIIGGSTYEGQALGDASNTTRMESPDFSGTVSERRWRLSPRAVGTALRLTFSDAVLTASGSNTNKVRLYSGSTLVAERATSALKKSTDNSVSDVTTSDLTLYFDLTAPEVAAITDWGALWAAAATAS